MEISVLFDTSLNSFSLRLATVGFIDLLINALLDVVEEFDWAHPLPAGVVLGLCDVRLRLFLDTIDFGDPGLLWLTE